jgi:hypothetical protein
MLFFDDLGELMSRFKLVTSLLLLVALSTISASSYSHHSRTNFVMNTLVELEGTITDYSYRNPHVYLTLDVVDNSGDTIEWLLEANSVSSVRLAGWSGDLFTVGERVTVTGNPDRNESKLLLFIDAITKTDGSSYRSSGIPPGGATASTGSEAGSTDFSGVWQPDFANRDIAAGFRPVNLPFTLEGQVIRDNFSALDDPALNGEAESIPPSLLPVFPVGFTRVGDDELHIWYEEFDGHRVIYLGMLEHPASLEPSLMGHSIGSIEGNVLSIDTIGFEETVWGLGRGAPSSNQKHLVEKYVLSADGMSLDVEYWFEDAKYLTERVNVTGQLLLKPGYELSAWDCDQDAAVRHNSVD